MFLSEGNINMNSFKRFDLLEAIELWAEDNGCISSEQELSDLFDDEVAQSVIDQYGKDDNDAIIQAFNDWSDGLCKDEQLHEHQYSSYGYVGKYS